jgi:hypothetical protein
MKLTKTVFAFILFAFLYACTDSETPIKNRDTKSTAHSNKKDFNEINFVYHFMKEELEKSHIEPAAYKPKVFNVTGTIRAQVYPEDTLIRLVYRSKSEQFQNDSSVGFMRLMKLEDKERAQFPQRVPIVIF